MHPIFILVGPSGSGKTTIMELLLEKHVAGLKRVITTTTRAPRPGESDGVEYWFLTKEAFKHGIERHAFVEWIQGFDNFYGTGRRELETQTAAGPVITVTDMPGALEIRKQFPKTHIVFLTVPKEQLIERLEARQSNADILKMRVEKIDRELATAAFADVVIDNSNGKLEEAAGKVEAFIHATMHKL